MIAFLKRLSAPMRSRKAQLGLAIRVTVAAFGALAIATAFNLMLPLWAVLTALIVTQMSVGRSLKATRDYMFGTVGGAIYGGAVAVLVPSMSHVNPLDSAVDRVLEVTVGAVTGLLVSFFVLPSRAHNQIRVSAARSLELIAAALSELLAGLTRGRDNDALHQIQDGIGAALVGLNATGAEAERERAAHLSSGPDTGPLLRTVLRLRHDVVMIGRASVVPLPSELQARLAAPLAKVSDAIAIYLGATAAALRSGVGAPAIWPIHEALQGYAAEIASLRSEGLTRGLPGDVAERFFALGFSLEQMRQNLKDLERCVAEWSETPSVATTPAED